MYIKTTLAVIGIAVVLAVGITATAQPVFAPTGHCSGCVRSLGPGLVSAAGLQGQVATISGHSVSALSHGVEARIVDGHASIVYPPNPTVNP
jgi:hypothetical protein